MQNYSPSDWKIIVKGHLVTGFATGTFMKVSRTSDSAKLSPGATGNQVLVGLLDRSGEVELTLQRESPSNDILSAMLAAFEARATVGAGVGEFLAKNINSTSLALSANAAVKKSPDMEAGTDGSNTVWTLLLDDVTIFNGGAIA